MKEEISKYVKKLKDWEERITVDGDITKVIVESIRIDLEIIVKKNGKVKCSNCGEMVEMISTGEFCPVCKC